MAERSVLEFAGRPIPSVEVLVNTARALASMRLALTPAPERTQVADSMAEELLLIARDAADVDAAFHLGQVAMLIRSDVRRAS